MTSKAILKSGGLVLPSIRRHYPGLIYICGGIDGAEVLNSVERLAMVTGQWQPVAPMIQRRRRGAAATVCGKLYVCGGWDGSQVLNTGERYDAAIGAWEPLPPMAETRDRAAAAVVAGRL